MRRGGRWKRRVDARERRFWWRVGFGAVGDADRAEDGLEVGDEFEDGSGMLKAENRVLVSWGSRWRLQACWRRWSVFGESSMRAFRTVPYDIVSIMYTQSVLSPKRR
jgi:hypothetical protein